MTDAELFAALQKIVECCTEAASCDGCPLYGPHGCAVGNPEECWDLEGIGNDVDD